MLVREPFHRDGSVYEEKVDGWRIVASNDGERVRLVSRNGVDHTRRFRDIAAQSRSCRAARSCSTARLRSTTSSSARGSEWLRDSRPRRGRHAAALHGVRPALPRRPRPERAAAPVIAAPGWRNAVAGSGLVFPVRRLAPDGLETGARALD
jgi:hypothetical protein